MPQFLPSLPRAPRRAFAVLALSSLIALALAGCAKDRTPTPSWEVSRSGPSRILGPDLPTTPSPWLDLQKHTAHLPYPLAVGNRWDYQIHMTSVITTPAGQQSPDVTESPWLVEITGTADANGRRYFLQSESDPRVMAPIAASPFYVRQDRTGLFELDLVQPLPYGAANAPRARGTLAAQLIASVDRMPAAAANAEAFHRAAEQLAQRVEAMRQPAWRPVSVTLGPTPPPGEIAMLRYPLYVGAAWIVRDVPRFARRVTARERLEVPAGAMTSWRIAGLSDLYGPNDRVNFWYGADGLLRIQTHAESNAVDNSGNVIGTVATDIDQVLTNVELHDPTPVHGFAAQETDQP